MLNIYKSVLNFTKFEVFYSCTCLLTYVFTYNLTNYFKSKLVAVK